MDRDFQEAEATFLRARQGLPTVAAVPQGPDRRVRKSDRVRKVRVFRPVAEIRKAHEAISKLNTQEFFTKLLGGGVEEAMWLGFMTGRTPKMDEYGVLVRDDKGMVVMEEVELNPISWSAFKRAVEYKRGMPLVTVEDNTEKTPKFVEVIMIGSNPQLFQEQAEAQGLLGIRKTEKLPELVDSKV